MEGGDGLPGVTRLLTQDDEDIAPYYYETLALSIVGVLNGLCFLAGAVTVVTFNQFQHLKDYPRNLYLYFVVANMIENSAYIVSVVLYNTSNPCPCAFAVVVAMDFAGLSEFVWLTCISIATFFEIKRKTLTCRESVMGNMEVVGERTEQYKNIQRRLTSFWYPLVCWVLPLVMMICVMVTILAQDPEHCDFYRDLLVSLLTPPPGHTPATSR